MRNLMNKLLFSVYLLSLLASYAVSASELLWQGAPDKTPIKLTFTHPGNKFTALRVVFSSPDEQVNLEISAKVQQGKAIYESRFSRNTEAKNGSDQLIDGLTQLPGSYDIKLKGKGASCSVFIEQFADLEPFSAGDPLGELVVTSAGGVAVSAIPEKCTIKHTDFKKGMDKGIATPDGKVTFRLPAGYWSLKRVRNGTENARLIPVSSGRRTVVRWASTPEINVESDLKNTAKRLEVRKVSIATDTSLAQSRFALPAGLSSFTPVIEQLQVFERFLPAEIVDLSQSDTPLHLVLLLDSSGSMKKSMQAAITATVKFIESLPADAIIEVIDFDTKAKPVKAGSRAELIKAVKAIKPDGATALRDSILLGLERLKNSQRPALVVFTDGFDANHNDTGPGSKATEKEVFAKVSTARIPIFTIGFGTGADTPTLARLADLSGGIFQVSDEKSLAEVFSRLEATVAREYLLTYRRPQKPGRGIRPVISICVDTSGSMESSLTANIAGSRKEMAKNTLHAMFKQLPKEALVQILDFDGNTEITQTATSNRARNHAGIAAFNAGGGTNVLRAIEVALEGLLSVPSNRRYMLFLTDEAIRVQNKKDEEKLNRLLARMKDEKIFSMWIGMVGKAGAAPFEETAKKADGEAIVADSLSALQQTIDKLLAKVAEPVEESQIPFELVWQMPQADSLPVAVSGNGIFELPPLTVNASSSEEAIDSLQISLEDLPGSSSNAVAGVAAGQTGTADHSSATRNPDSMGSSNEIASFSAGQIQAAPSTARLTLNFDARAQNSACNFHIRQMALHDELNGVKAPAKKLFAVFDLELTNILPEQDVAVYPDGGQHPAQWVNETAKNARIIKAVPPYQIDDLRRHLYLRWNNEPATPCSPAGWLLQDSLTGFGGHSLIVRPGQPATGKIVFLVSEDQGLSNGSIDYFDKNYGHCSLIIAGKMAPADLRAASLPTSPAGRLGTAFNIKINGVEDAASPLAGATAGKHLVWRLVDFVIESQVQALLDIDPRARMYLTLPTSAGPVRRPLSKVTALLPGGFFERVRLAPGSTNHCSQAFLLPAELANAASGTICVDMKGDDSFISLNPAEPFNGLAAERTWNAKGNGLSIKINAQGKLASINNKKGDWFVVDATVADVADGSATKLDKLLFLGRADLKDQGFKLNPGQRMIKTADNKAGHKGIGSFSGTGEADGNQTRIYPDGINQTLMFAANGDTFVPDGQETRFIAIFRIPAAGEYLLAAESLPLAESLSSSELKDFPAWLLSANDEVIPSLPETFEKQLATRLKQLATANRRNQSDKEFLQATDADGNISDKPATLSPPLILPAASVEDNQIRLDVIIEAEPVAESAAAQTGAAASALSGGGQKMRSFKVINCVLAASDTCKTPFEICYSEVSDKTSEKSLKATVIGHWGSIEGRDSIDLKNWKPVREKICFAGKGINWPLFERELKDNGLNERVHSVALAMPDISAEQADDLKKRWEAARSEKAPDHISLWQWFAHARLAAFIVAQTSYEQTLAEKLSVTLSRTKAPRLIILTGAANDSGAFEARLDLVGVQPVVSGDDQAVKSFRIAAGLFVTELEAKVMEGRGVFQFWGNNRLQIIADSGKQKKAWLKFAASRGVSERALNAIRNTRAVVLFPQNPAMINDQPFWAWLEIDPKTYATIGVLETGERGTIAGEAIIQALIPDGAGLALGFWKGVETSIWGMSAFILQGDSALQAAANTEKLMGDLSEKLGKIGESLDVPVGDANIDLLSGKVTLAGFSSDGDYSPWDGYKGFVTGFNSGTSWYLNKVRAAAAGK